MIWNVIVSLPVEIELQIEAENEDIARISVAALVDNNPMHEVSNSLYATAAKCEVIEAYEPEGNNAT